MKGKREILSVGAPTWCALLVVTRLCGAGVIADSVADFNGVQGGLAPGAWSYGYFNVSSHADGYHATPGGSDYFQELPFYGSGPSTRMDLPGVPAWQFNTSFNPWTFLSADKAHPNGTDQWSGYATNPPSVHWAVRRYVNGSAGNLQVDWHLAKADITYGNGVTGRIFVNGDQIDSATIAFNDNVGVTRSITAFAVPQGAFVDIVLDATGTYSMPAYGGSGNGQDDLSVLTALITLTPEPRTLLVWAALSVPMLLLRRR